MPKSRSTTDLERALRPPERLRDLRNIGKAMLADFAVLGIESVAQLAAADADVLYERLQVKTGKRHDPCVWDTFAAAIHQARTGEARDWWVFTAVRKQRVSEGRFPPNFVPPSQPAPRKR